MTERIAESPRTRRGVAHAAGLSPTHLQAIETGEVDITLCTLYSLGHALDADPVGLLSDAERELKRLLTAEA